MGQVQHIQGGSRSRRRFLGLAAGTGAVMAALGLRDLASPTRSRAAPEEEAAAVVRAQRFELVDANGTVRAAMAMTADSRPMVALLDEAGQARMLMQQTQEEGGYGFEIHDADGTLRFEAFTTARSSISGLGLAGLNVRDATGARRLIAAALNDGSSAVFNVSDEHGKRRAYVGLPVGGLTYAAEIDDAAGRVLWQAPAGRGAG